jgi:hypothetical protein
LCGAVLAAKKEGFVLHHCKLIAGAKERKQQPSIQRNTDLDGRVCGRFVGQCRLRNAPDCAYAAVLMQFNITASNFIEHSEKYEPMPTDAERYDNTASMMSEEDVNQVACLGDISFHRKGVLLPYALNYCGNQRRSSLVRIQAIAVSLFVN